MNASILARLIPADHARQDQALDALLVLTLLAVAVCAFSALIYRSLLRRSRRYHAEMTYVGHATEAAQRRAFEALTEASVGRRSQAALEDRWRRVSVAAKENR